MADTADLILGPMLRHVGSTHATVWVETDAPCDVTVLGRVSRTFTVSDHHYALVMIEGLEPGTTVRYDVMLDGVVRWPLSESTLPDSAIRTVDGSAVRVLFGSCRTAAPHEPPWTLEMALDPQGRGVDALRAHAIRMLQQPPDQWPHLAVFLGDQVYADDSSPHARERIAERRLHMDVDGLPPELVGDLEEYTWLYHESWSPEIERWFFSVVPSAMIFDDHEMVDDWNISAAWVRDIRRQGWWSEHIIGGLMSYWIYQHLGNLSPTTIRQEGILDSLLAVDDGTEILRTWALQSEEFTPVPGGYQFSFARELGNVKLVMIDTRNGRVLEPGRRSMVDHVEWAWIVQECQANVDHLLIGSSVPAFVPGGMHDLQRWNESLSDGLWGARGARIGERLRQTFDVEDWPAFGRSFDALVDLLAELGGAHRSTAPATISILSGDIHFSYRSRLRFPDERAVSSVVHQLVGSPIRNALRPFERAAMRFGMSRIGGMVGRSMRRLAGGTRTPVQWKLDDGPVFGNCVSVLTFKERRASLIVEQATNDDDDRPTLQTVFEVDLTDDERRAEECRLEDVSFELLPHTGTSERWTLPHSSPTTDQHPTTDGAGPGSSTGARSSR